MKHSKQCPKCGSSSIVRVNGHAGAYGSGNNIQLGMTIFSAVKLNQYICLRCGYVEAWIDEDDLEKIAESDKAQPI